MTFQPGNKFGKGRPKGAITGKNRDYAIILESEGFNPARAKLRVFNEAFKNYEACPEERRPIYLQIALNAAKEMAPYVYPKLSSIEFKQDNQFAEMTPQEKIEAMKQAIKLIEHQEKE